MKNKIILSLLFSLSFVLCSMAQTATISGRISKIDNAPLPKITVNINGGNFSSTTSTNASGVYVFEDVPTGATYTIQPELDKSVARLNGVTTFDVVLILKEIVKAQNEDVLFSPVAADVNEDGRISILDTWVMRQQILGIVDFPGLANWKFIPLDFDYYDSPKDIPNSISLSLTSTQENVDFTGVKLGDVNGSAIVE